MNLVDLKSSSVTGNHVRNAGYGISLWSTTGMESVVISGNTVAITQVTHGIASSWGIATTYDADFNGDFSDLQITGNIVRFEQESSSRTINGSANYGIGLQAPGNISNALILGNEITRAPVRGIAVGVLDGRYTTSRVSVVHNRIVDAGSNVSPARCIIPPPSACRATCPRSTSCGIGWTSSPTPSSVVTATGRSRPATPSRTSSSPRTTRRQSTGRRQTA